MARPVQACSMKGCWRPIKAPTKQCAIHQPKPNEAQREAEAKRQREYGEARQWQRDHKAFLREAEEVLAEGKEFHARHQAFFEEA